MEGNRVMSDTPDHLVDDLGAAAGTAARAFAHTGTRERAALLDDIAGRLEHAGDRLVSIAARETHLADGRLRSELQRTAYQSRLLGRAIVAGRHLRAVVEHADSDYPLGGPAPDLRSIAYPLGPVAVFAASNFPFAFSVAGGDTASALAAGCPVIVKGHPAHPELSREVAALITDAVTDAGLPVGVFGFIEGESAGVRLLRHPALRAAAFTGSTMGGRALFGIAAARPDPIPFYGELGSVNPVYVTVEAVKADRDGIAEGFVDSFTMGVGQFCTKPGLVFVPAGSRFAEHVASALRTSAPSGRMLSERIRSSYDALEDAFLGAPDVEALVIGSSTMEGVTPSLFRTTVSAFLARSAELTAERFGPSALVVEYDEPSELRRAAALIEGTLTSTLWAAGADDSGLRELLPELQARSGRIIFNGWPTGVTVSAAMMHGGPFPASTSAAHTSVGLSAIDRFLRPIAYQNFPAELLPAPLRDDADIDLPREVDLWRARA